MAKLEYRALEITRHTELTDKMSLHFFEFGGNNHETGHRGVPPCGGFAGIPGGWSACVQKRGMTRLLLLIRMRKLKPFANNLPHFKKNPGNDKEIP
jgi:hypothetical protein